MCTWNSILRVIETTIGSCLLSNVQQSRVRGESVFCEIRCARCFFDGSLVQEKSSYKINVEWFRLGPAALAAKHC